MKNVKTILISTVLLVLACTVNAATVVETTNQLSQQLTNGIVRIVIKFDANKYLQKDVGVILHKDATFTQGTPPNGWNDGVALIKIEHNSGAPYFQGYDAAWVDPKFNLDLTKRVAFWFTVDVANNSYQVSYQVEGEQTVTDAGTAYASRLQGASHIEYCTTTFNDVGSVNQAGCVITVDPATIVSSIQPYTFDGATKLASAEGKQVNIYPTVVDDVLTIQSEEAIRQVAVLSLNGQALITTDAAQTIDVAQLNAGIYMVKVTTEAGQTSFQKIMKK